MINGTRYLVLTQSGPSPQSFAYYLHPDNESVNVLFRDADGEITLGPWRRETADRHADRLRALGYLQVERDGTPPQRGIPT
ncbi:MAG: hypothetical protein HY613_09005 [Candidatus Rokubacteria bacterium]|nr:hypothetical protein [Candidatus Rokubacteria bacterium]